MSESLKDQRAAKQTERKEKKTAAIAEQEKKDRRYRRNTIIVIVIAVVLIVFALAVNSNFFYRNTTALTVGGTKYSPAEVSYFYRNTYNNMYQSLYSQLGDMTSMLLDTSKPLNEQAYPYAEDENTTWADAIADSAQEQMVSVTAMYDAAIKAGRTLTAEDQEYVASSVDTMRMYASSNGYSNLNKFLSAYFGKGVDEKLFTKLQERIVIASDYSAEIQDSFSYPADELASYYAEHADEFDYYSYYAYPVSSSLSAFEGLEGDALTEAIHAAAQDIVDATTDTDSFIAAVKALAGDDTVPSIANNHADSIGDTYKEWITDEARQPGDTAVFDSDDLTYAVLFLEHDHNDYNTVDFRHILFKAEADEDGVYTEEALNEAKAKAEAALAEWETNPTEDNFADLANSRSEDSGSNTNGGLYTEVTKHTMVPGVNAFLFDEGKAAGDTGIVLGQSSGYTGYHVMYFAGEGERNCDLLAKNEMLTADYNEKYEEITKGYKISEGSGLRLVKL